MDEMTWKKFKELAESHGVKDDMEINYIDISPWEDDGLDIFIENNNSFRIS